MSTDSNKNLLNYDHDVDRNLLTPSKEPKNLKSLEQELLEAERQENRNSPSNHSRYSEGRIQKRVNIINLSFNDVNELLPIVPTNNPLNVEITDVCSRLQLIMGEKELAPEQGPSQQDMTELITKLKDSLLKREWLPLLECLTREIQACQNKLENQRDRFHS